MTAETEDNVRPATDKAQRNGPTRRSNGTEAEISTLKRALQEQRRAVTLLNAEAQKQLDAREALETQLIEANAEIVASWERRKEMARVIGDRDAQINEHKQRRKEMAQIISKREEKIGQLEEKIRELEAHLQARYEELAKLQQQLVGWNPLEQARRLFGRARKLGG